ncbi:MAG: hypothetical protein JXK93_03645 [Sphaerochaetaceae bacterium]|nr:hypothetical protein [Sphaerochaetaceae bacterium]
MPIFIRNFSMNSLMSQGEIDSDIMLDLYSTARWKHAHGAFYMVKELENRVQFIFRGIPDGKEIKVLGTDTHYHGSCIWKVYPFFNATPEGADPLSALIAFTNSDQTTVAVSHIVNAAVLPELTEGEGIDVQVAGFPLLLESYENRESFEKHFSQDASNTPWPVLVPDRKILPINFMLAHDPDLKNEDKQNVQNVDILLLASKVLGVHRSEGLQKGEFFNVATVSCEFGHLDLVFSDDLCDTPVPKGSYIVTSFILSSDVALGTWESWVQGS